MARSKRKGPRPKTYAQLKSRLDAVFSIWTRRRFADENGMVRCITCQRLSHWKDLHAGHFIARHHLAGRWLPENVHPQCPADNLFRKGAYPEYAAWGVNHYGQSWLTDMVALKRQSVKWSRTDLAQMVEDYTARVEAMG